MLFGWFNLNANEYYDISWDIKATFVLDRVPDINSNTSPIACHIDEVFFIWAHSH